MSPFDALPRPLGVVIHDAGAANMVAAWAKAARHLPERVIAKGPAAAIWVARFGPGSVDGDDPTELGGLNCVVTGTGWASDLEHDARRGARDHDIVSIAVIDHWVNYAPRFERDGLRVLPDHIWVGDSDAARIAKDAFPGTPIHEHANLYLAEQAHNAGATPENGDALFILEPARSDWGKGQEGEFQALDFFMESREKAGIDDSVPVRIRPHPSDPPGKYDEWLAAHSSAQIDRSPDMGAALRTARYVIGMNSAGLVIALKANRQVFSALPDNAPSCVLPHSGIVHLSAL
ncbi:MAG: hypothetical protein SXU28_00750 [Pseudomonadota bacterium]|nr:hypothetical protein [Pseudomonadota bacterium]